MPRLQDPQARNLLDLSDNHYKILHTLLASLVWFATATTLLFYYINLVLTTSANFLRKGSPICLNELFEIEQKCLNTSLKNYF